MNMLRQALLGLGLLAAVAGWYLWQQHQLRAAHAATQAATQRVAALTAELQAAKTDTRIVVRYVDRVRTIHERGRTLTQQVPIYVPQRVDAACTINRGFVRVFNAATAAADLPAAAGPADAAAAGIALSAVASTSIDNFATYHTVAAQLIALQTWVRSHSTPPVQPP